MRLIDADVLIKAIQQHMVKINSLFEEEKTVVEIIDAQPTAYDIEKVVAEFEQKIEFYRLMEIETLHKGMASNTRTYTSNRFCFENALEIVKRGDRE